MATFQEVILEALQNGQMKMTSVNQGIIELSKGTNKKSAFVKTAITDELVEGLMSKTRVAFILHMDADELNALNLSIESTEQHSEAEAG